MAKEYNMRPGLYPDYTTMNKTVTKKTVFESAPEKDSWNERPYMADNYQDLSEFFRTNFDSPYTTPDIRFDNPAVATGAAAKDCGCNGAILKVVPSLSSIDCGGSVSFSMG